MKNPYESYLTLLPPSPVSTKVPVEIRVGLRNRTATTAILEVSYYLDEESPEALLGQDVVRILPNGIAAPAYLWHPTNQDGMHRIIVVVRGGPIPIRLTQDLEVIESETRSTDTIDGAFSGFYHWSETEGRLWNAELRQFEVEDWHEMVRAQHALGMNIIVPQESFRNEQYVGKHSIDRDGYQGLAFYPSDLVIGRMPITTVDPLECMLDEADRLGMHVFLPVGMYAWFDFTPGSLKWHKEVATELWERYGHHASAYGWYVSEEIHGNLGETPADKEAIITFFREFRAHCNAMAPGKPVMLASNCHGVKPVQDYYRRLLPHLDILCPFGFHRMPPGDLTGSEVSALLQQLCDESGTHFWLDQEAFLFKPDKALYPRPIEELVADFPKFSNFEKIVCYQFPGLFNRPGSRRTPGGEDTVQLYLDYKNYLLSKGRTPTRRDLPTPSENREAEVAGPDLSIRP